MQTEYFWKQQDDIPAGMGYPLFGIAHLLCVAVTLLAAALMVKVFKKMDAGRQKRFLRGIPVFMLFLELFKDGFLLAVGRFGLGYLPLHVCSIGIFVFLLREFLPWERAKEIFGEIAFALIMPASMAALIFADWTVYYPVWNFINIHSYIWHGALVLYPVLLLVCGCAEPSITHMHWTVIFLCLIVPPIYLFDKRFGCNYFFVNWPVPNSPLSWLESFMGNPGYLVGYGIMVLGTMAAVYLCAGAVRRIRSRID